MRSVTEKIFAGMIAQFALCFKTVIPSYSWI